MKTTEITIGVINYNGLAALATTLPALQALTYPVKEVVVIDNGSTDGSREWLQDAHPEVRCISLPANLGPPGARNILLETGATDYVFILDNDISVEPETLTRLMAVMQTEANVGVCHPEIRDKNDPTVHHYNGGWIHYLGTFVSRPKPDDARGRAAWEQFDVVSGAALLINKAAAQHVGLFDAAYFFNWEDGDFTARLTLAGYRCLNVPSAVVHHRSKPRGTSKVFYQVRNRWYFMLKLYHWRTLWLIAPMLCLFELLQAAFLIKKGAFADYWRGNLAVLKDLPDIRAKRRAFQALKKVPDKNWLYAGDMYIPATLNQGPMILNKLQQAFYGLCRAYWRMVIPLCG
jgi:GT2 family glycosyltransferase